MTQHSNHGVEFLRDHVSLMVSCMLSIGWCVECVVQKTCSAPWRCTRLSRSATRATTGLCTAWRTPPTTATSSCPAAPTTPSASTPCCRYDTCHHKNQHCVWRYCRSAQEIHINFEIFRLSFHVHWWQVHGYTVPNRNSALLLCRFHAHGRRQAGSPSVDEITVQSFSTTARGEFPLSGEILGAFPL
jgi:hypothetical protein